MNLKKLKKEVVKARNFGMNNTLAILTALNSLEKSVNKLSKRKIKIELKEGRYKGLFERMIRQNKLIIDILKVCQGITPAEECNEEKKRLESEIA